MSLLNLKPEQQPPAAPRRVPKTLIAGSAMFAWLLLLLAVAVGLGVGQGGCSLEGESITDPGFGVLIVEETQDETEYTGTQLDAMKSTAPGSLREYVGSKGGVFLLLDKDDAVDQAQPVIREVWGKARPSLPWMYVWHNRRLVGAPLTTEAAALKLAKAQGG